MSTGTKKGRVVLDARVTGLVNLLGWRARWRFNIYIDPSFYEVHLHRLAGYPAHASTASVRVLDPATDEASLIIASPLVDKTP